MPRPRSQPTPPAAALTQDREGARDADPSSLGPPAVSRGIRPSVKQLAWWEVGDFLRLPKVLTTELMRLVFRYFPNFGHWLIAVPVFAVSACGLHQGSVNIPAPGRRAHISGSVGRTLSAGTAPGRLKRPAKPNVPAVGVAEHPQALTGRNQAADGLAPGGRGVRTPTHTRIPKTR